MSQENEPVTLWLNALQDGDPEAARQIWGHFFSRLQSLARRKLSTNTRAAYDEDDAMQSAFFSFCSGMEKGNYPNLKNRDELWRLLLVITSRKIAQRHRYELRECRDARKMVSDRIFQETGENPAGLSLDEPTPEFAVEFADTCEALLQQLPGDELKETVLLKLEGLSEAEIAERANCSTRTVQRRLEIARRCWDKLDSAGT